MIAETKLAIEDQPRMLVKEPSEVECRKLYLLFANIEAHGRMGSCPGYALLIWQEERQNHVRMDSESESEELLRETWHQKPGWREPWQEKPGWKYTRTESLRESESERREELELSEVQGMCA